MIIPGISALASGARVNAAGRARSVKRDDGLSFDVSVEEADELSLLRKRYRQARQGKDAIKAGGSPASRSSPGVLDQLTRLKPGG